MNLNEALKEIDEAIKDGVPNPLVSQDFAKGWEVAFSSARDIVRRLMRRAVVQANDEMSLQTLVEILEKRAKDAGIGSDYMKGWGVGFKEALGYVQRFSARQSERLKAAQAEVEALSGGREALSLAREAYPGRASFASSSFAVRNGTVILPSYGGEEVIVVFGKDLHKLRASIDLAIRNAAIAEKDDPSAKSET